MRRSIIGFHEDREGHWVADLECGHSQHVRHEPPWQVRPWVQTPEGRAAMIGTALDCALCKECPGRAPPGVGMIRLQLICRSFGTPDEHRLSARFSSVVGSLRLLRRPQRTGGSAPVSTLAPGESPPA